MWGAALRTQWKVPLRFTSRTSRHSSSLMRCDIRSRVRPALQTSTSSWPKASTASFISASVYAGSVTLPTEVLAAPSAIASQAARASSAGRLVEIVDHHPRTLAHEELRDGAPDAPPRPRDHRHASVQPSHGPGSTAPRRRARPQRRLKRTVPGRSGTVTEAHAFTIAPQGPMPMTR